MEKNSKEKEIRSITQTYYSRKEVQEAIYNFSKNREISPRYFEGFGKRPDSFQFLADIFSLVKKGATSFHCSEELWENPLELESGMEEKNANELRIGWDLLLDIDCTRGIEFSKYAAQAIIETLKRHKIQNIGIKFSGSKGFHILIPWKSFPKEINGEETKNLFPELPRKIVAYIRNYSAKIMKEVLPENFEKNLKGEELKEGFICNRCGEFSKEYRFVEFSCNKCGILEIKKLEMGTKGKIPKCYKCKKPMSVKPLQKFLYCDKCNLDSIKHPENFSQKKEYDLYDLMGLDIILVSPRHLFRMPYSLHEKSSLSSVVLDEEELKNFNKKLADPFRVKIKNFMPEVEEGEAKELVLQALDWAKDSGFDEEKEEKAKGKYANFKPIKLKNIEDKQFPPCIKKILEGLKDGKKRALFALINFLRSIGMEQEELEKKIHDWNLKNEPPLKKGYVVSQLSWSYKHKPILPPNCKDFYRDLGVCSPDMLCNRVKNPVNYLVKKNFVENKNKSKKKNKKEEKK